jgi:hypothetical protein
MTLLGLTKGVFWVCAGVSLLLLTQVAEGYVSALCVAAEGQWMGGHCKPSRPPRLILLPPMQVAPSPSPADPVEGLEL